MDGKVNVDKIYPAVGTKALAQEFGSRIMISQASAMTYVKTEMLIRLVQLISQALSASTLLFLSLISEISFSTSIS